MTQDIFLIVGIFVLCSFYTFAAISFLKHRLPKKKIEYIQIQQLLDNKKVGFSKEDKKEVDGVFKHDYDGTDYILPVFFVTLFCVMGFYLLFSGNSPIVLGGILTGETEKKLSYYGLSLVSMGMAILGSYVWSIQYIVRRLITVDLAPSAYYSIGTRIIFATFVSLILRHFIAVLPEKASDMFIDQLPAISFFTGIFPQRAMQYMQERLRIFNPPSEKAHNLPLEMIEGISQFTKIRLAEIGIDNAQNLALANFKEMIIKTPFNPRMILDWIAQAKLYIIVKDGIAELRKVGIRNVFGLITAYSEGQVDTLDMLSEKIGTDLSLVCADLKDRPDILVLIEIRKKLCAY